MKDKAFQFWRRWLIVVSSAGVLFGLLLPVLGASETASGWYNTQLARVFFEATPVTPEMQAYNLWVWSMLGAVIAAWGIALLFLVLYPFQRRERWAWYAVAVSLVVAFVMDAGMSLYFGFYLEVVVALGWFLPVAIPLVALRASFFAMEV